MTVQIKPEQIRWRVGQVSKKDAHKGMLLGYIDSRTAMELLDEQDAEWSDAYQIVKIDGAEGIECSLTVKGVTRTDVGVPSNTEGLKGAYSDALKRAAVKHGIGRELYELPRIWVTLDDYKRPTTEPAFRNGRWTLPSGSGSVFYDHEPTEQPERPAGGSPSSPKQAAPVQRSPEEAALLDELLAVKGMTAARASLLADAVGVPKGQRANADQLREMLARTVDTPPTDESSGAATAPGSDGGPPPATAEPGPAPTLDDVLAVTGGEVVHPAPGSEAYKALPAHEKAAARAWHQEHKELAL